MQSKLLPEEKNLFNDIFQLYEETIYHLLMPRFEKYEELTKVLGPCPQLRSGVVTAITKYWTLASIEAQPSIKTQKSDAAKKMSALVKLRKMIEKNIACASDDPDVRNLLQRASDKCFVKWWALANKSNALPKSFLGRPQREASERFVQDIEDIYFAVTGKNPTVITNLNKQTGEFVDLLSAVEQDARTIMNGTNEKLNRVLSGSIVRYAKHKQTKLPGKAASKVRTKNRSLAD
jgi:hypothetical protein